MRIPYADHLADTDRRIGELLTLPIFSDDERRRIVQLRKELAALPDTLAPFLDYPIGIRVFAESALTRCRDIMGIARAAAERMSDPRPEAPVSAHVEKP